jgi:hypothetical protein
MGCTASKFQKNSTVTITENQAIVSDTHQGSNFASKNERDIVKKIRVVDLDIGVRKFY